MGRLQPPISSCQLATVICGITALPGVIILGCSVSIKVLMDSTVDAQYSDFGESKMLDAQVVMATRW